MNTQRSLLSLVLSLVGIVALSACNLVSEPKTAANDHLHFSLKALSIDEHGRYSLMVPVNNGDDMPSPSAELIAEIEYKTIANGGDINCDSDIDPTSPPCKPPVRCSETLVYQIPSSKAHSWWESPRTMIGPATGECACLPGQCEGSVRLSLRSAFDPTLEKRMNVTQLNTWNMAGDIFYSGYDMRPPDQENWP